MKRVVAGIIEDGHGKVLLAQRPPGKYLEGLWEFPGGKIEAGETPETALKRELQEELHLDVRIGKNLGSFPFKYPDHAIELVVFQVTALGTPRPTEDVQVFRWLPASAISHSDLAPADVLPLQRYLALSPMHESP
jgi:8-oxo-dGTP diphosphatase